MCPIELPRPMEMNETSIVDVADIRFIAYAYSYDTEDAVSAYTTCHIFHTYKVSLQYVFDSVWVKLTMIHISFHRIHIPGVLDTHPCPVASDGL